MGVLGWCIMLRGLLGSRGISRGTLTVWWAVGTLIFGRLVAIFWIGCLVVRYNYMCC